MRKTLAALALTVAAFAGVAAAPAATAAPAPVVPVAAARQAVTIPDGAIWIRHIAAPAYNQLITVQAPNSIYWSNLNNGIVSEPKLAADVKAKLNPVQADTNVTGYPIHHVGGSIFTDAKATEVPFSDITLQPGKKYKIEYAAQAEWADGVTDFTVPVQFQVSPWLNKNADANYDTNEAVKGAAPARSYMPQLANREASASGFVIYTHPADAEPVGLQIAGYGYDNAGSAAYNGKIKLTTVSLSATLIG